MTSKLTTQAKLKIFLEALAKESYLKAQEDLSAKIEQERQDSLLRRLETFNTSKSQDINEEEDEEDLEKKKKPDENDAESKNPLEDQDEEDPDDENDDQDQKIRFKDIRDTLNTIRAGRSLKDKEIRDELKAYFNDLDDAEKIALYSYLDAIQKIITQGINNEFVKDPSDDPYDIKMKKVDKKTEKKPQDSSKQKDASKSDQTKSKEDTTPPISVGKQTTESIRRAVRKLMES